jgi:excinuclease ABC subunit C
VGACVVFERDTMQPGEYRRYNMRGATAGDDLAAMREALQRRYARTDANDARIPDLLLIDGGKTQLATAAEVLGEYGLHDIVLVGVAKGVERRAGHETLLLEPAGRELHLGPTHPGLQLVQEIRDEAHRFALLGHRKRRGRARTASVLADIPGVGDFRRRRLLAHFGGLRGVENAAMDEIARVGGIGPALAEKIYAHFHPRGAR